MCGGRENTSSIYRCAQPTRTAHCVPALVQVNLIAIRCISTWNLLSCNNNNLGHFLAFVYRDCTSHVNLFINYHATNVEPATISCAGFVFLGGCDGNEGSKVTPTVLPSRTS